MKHSVDDRSWSDANPYYYLKDHLGTVHALTDTNGAIVESYRYDAWGRVTVFDANNQQLDNSAIGNRFLFQGREYSWATGLYYFRARWYDPIIGRWLSNDPIDIQGGLNQYVFCDNNPISNTDPKGFDSNNPVVQFLKTGFIYNASCNTLLVSGNDPNNPSGRMLWIMSPWSSSLRSPFHPMTWMRCTSTVSALR